MIKRKTPNIFVKSMLLIGGCGALISCGAPPFQYKLMSAGFFAAKEGLFLRPDVNLKEKNNAAADYVIGKFGHRFTLHDDIYFTPLEELDHAGVTSPFGRYVSEGIGMRFSDLGYKVWLKDVAVDGNADLSPAPPENHLPDLVLKGTYSVKQKNVDVSLRLLNTKTRQIVAHFDYTMPVTREIREMAKTETRIFKVKAQ